MAGDRRKSGGLDRNRIDLRRKHEIRYWTDELQVDGATLRDAVAEVGTRADIVRRRIEELRASSTRRSS